MPIACLMWVLLILSSLPTGLATTATLRQGMHMRVQTRMHAQMQMESRMESRAAPSIRKVIRLLQELLRQNAENVKLDAKISEKAICKCKKEVAAQLKIVDFYSGGLEGLEQTYKELTAQVHQMRLDVREAEDNLEKAKKALRDAEELYEKENRATLKQLRDYKINIEAIEKAIGVLRRGLGSKSTSAFLQTGAADTLRKLIVKADMSDGDRDALASFLDDGNTHQNDNQDDSDQPGTEEIIGILRQLRDSMIKDQEDLKTATAKGKIEYEAMVKDKEAEIDSLEDFISRKTSKMAELMVKLSETKAAIADILSGGYLREKELYDQMKRACDKTTNGYETRKKLRAEEAFAINQALELLNSDEALDLFKQTLPKATSLLQLQVSQKALLSEARRLIKKHKHDYRADYISLLMQGKKVDMTKVTTMIDQLVGLLTKEASEDEDKKDSCEKEMGEAQFRKARLAKQVGPIRAELDEINSDIEEMTNNIDEMNDAIKTLDETVNNAKLDRQQENAQYVKEAAADSAALDLLQVARQRLHSYYGSYMQVSSSDADDDDQQPPKAKQNGAPVMDALQAIINELTKSMTANKLIEKMAQEDYEELLERSKKSRDTKLEMLEQYRDNRAKLNLRLQKFLDEKRQILDEAMALDELIKNLHIECDWLLTNWKVRTNARKSEIDSLKKAKAVLLGADFGESLIQEGVEHHRVKLQQPTLRGSKAL